MRDWKPALLALAIVLSGAGRAAGGELALDWGPYMALHGGVNFTDTQFDDSGVILSGALGKPEYEAGPAVGVAAGYKWQRWRLEGELTYRRNAFDEIEWFEIGKEGTFETDGTLSSYAVMANLFWDVPTGSTGIVPSLGGGLGLAVVTLDDVSDSDGPLFDETEVAFALQLGVGLGYAVTDSIVLSVDYRLFAGLLLHPRIDSNQPGVGGESTDAAYLNTSLWLGLRYRF